MRQPDGRFMDIGSTTTDLVPLVAGAVAAVGEDDAGRLAAGELAYTGLTRSFVMAMAPRAPFGKCFQRLPAGIHQRHHRRRQSLAKDQGGCHRQGCDNVQPHIAAPKAGDDLHQQHRQNGQRGRGPKPDRHRLLPQRARQ